MPHFTPNLNGNTPDDIRNDLLHVRRALALARENLGQLRSNTCHSRNYTDQEGRRKDLLKIDWLSAQMRAFETIWIDEAARICNEAEET